MQQTNVEDSKKRNKRISVVKLQLIKEKYFPYKTNVIKSPEDAARLLQEYIGLEDREHFVLICLDTKNKITQLNTVSIGSLNASIVTPREVFKLAILSNSASIIVGHNHPSGIVKPSPEDIEVTNRLQEVGKLMGIELLDHIIVGDCEKYFSLKENGYF